MAADSYGRRRGLRDLLHDNSGAALIYMTALLPVLVGFSLLAVDASRVYILNSSLQHGADAIALAMAAELDRTSDALSRADRAKNRLVSNPALFTDSFPVVSGLSVTRRFLTSLPASDSAAITDAYVTTTPAAARYVEVKVNVASYDTIFPAAFIEAAANLSTSAVAVAGLDAGACNIVPMFICNPLEPADNADPARITELLTHVADSTQRRRLFELKAFPNNGQSQFSPGNFGYVETPLGNGARNLSDAIAQATPGACITLSAMTTKPGNTNVASDAFNVRFDMYGGSFSKSDSNLRPARNTRKSWTPAKNGANKECRPSEVTDLYTGNYKTPAPLPPAMGFPRDTCLLNDTCANRSGVGGRLGGGDWNSMYTLYMTMNFGNNSTNWPKKPDGSAFSTAAATLPSRYEVYRAEVDQSKMNSESMSTPACYNNASVPVSDNPDRRVINVAIANCIAEPIGSGSTTVRAAAIGQFFLTEPVGTQGSVYGEMVRVFRAGSDSGTNGALLTDNVQLYR